jgi:hypothetical protein
MRRLQTFDCAPSGTAGGCGEDFRQKILDCGGTILTGFGAEPHQLMVDFHRKILYFSIKETTPLTGGTVPVRRTLRVLLMFHLFEIRHAEAPKSVNRIF